jgi:hypothetical protein
MISRTMIAAVALSLLVATPVTAMAQGQHRNTRHVSAAQSPLTSRSVFDAYALEKTEPAAPSTTDFDFQRRNTFN